MGIEFPSPINGVSFKLDSKLYIAIGYSDEFPSPINGVSFKPKEVDFGEIPDSVKFPSPINGVSFKHKVVFAYDGWEVIGFRPL